MSLIIERDHFLTFGFVLRKWSFVNSFSREIVVIMIVVGMSIQVEETKVISENAND